MMYEIKRTKAIWTSILLIFLVLALGISYYLYTHYRGFNYFENPPSYYDEISFIKLTIFSVFQFISCIACVILAINLLLEKLDIDYERLFYITCFSLCITIIILEYFKYWERMYNELIEGSIIVGTTTIAIFILLGNFIKDKISNKYAEIKTI